MYSSARRAALTGALLPFVLTTSALAQRTATTPAAAPTSASAHAAALKRLSYPTAALAVVAEVVPFGPFVLDSRLRREEPQAEPEREAACRS